MLKNKLVHILFLSVATLILISHAVIPHHHHESEVYSVSAHEHDSAPDDHQDHPESDNHNGSDDYDLCILNLPLPAPNHHKVLEIPDPVSFWMLKPVNIVEQHCLWLFSLNENLPWFFRIDYSDPAFSSSNGLRGPPLF